VSAASQILENYNSLPTQMQSVIVIFSVNMFVSYRQKTSAEVLQSQRLVSLFALFIDVATSINNTKSDTSHCKHQ